MKKLICFAILISMIITAFSPVFARSPQKGNYHPADLKTMSHPFVDQYRFGGNFFRAKLLEKTEDGWLTRIYLPDETVEITVPETSNNLASRFERPGQRILVNQPEGREHVFFLSRPDRINRYILFIIICLVLCVAVGGKPTMRGLLCVFGGILLFIFWTLPRVQAGSPVIFEVCFFYLLVAICVLPSSLGLNKRALSAIAAALSTGVISVVFLSIITWWIPTTGLYNESVRVLDYAMRYYPEQIADFPLSSLVIGATLIGALGVVLDVTIDVTASASEIVSARPDLPFTRLLKRVMTVSRRLVGTMTNTLLLAYVGTDMLLLFTLYMLPEPFLLTLNRDLTAMEVIRALGGAIGFLAAVPLSVTFFTLICRKQVEEKPPPPKH